MPGWDLSSLTWTLRGWRQNDWELALTPERARVKNSDVGPIQAQVPGSVRGALLASELVADPMFGQQSRLSEWIENRHWQFTAPLPSGIEQHLSKHPEWQAILEFPRLDNAGTVLIDESVVGTFAGSFTPHHFDITEFVTSGRQTLSVVFTDVPDGLGQNGWTSRIRDWKPRYNYGWDWTPRIVQIGIPEHASIQVGPLASLQEASISALTDPAAVRVDLTRCSLAEVSAVQIAVSGSGLTVTKTIDVDRLDENATTIVPVGEPEQWQVRPRGAQSLYDVRVSLLSAEDAVLCEASRRVGFRSIEWQETLEAPEGADRWLCVVNGKALFLAGVNWVPIRPDYADVTDDEYRARLTAYRDIGLNFVRVWGGAASERSVFYELCDELGILVWQELPLSSSGLDNEPPADLAFSEQLARIATEYALKLAHHPCLIMWGGGNELTRVNAPAVPGAPLTVDHPALAAAAAAFLAADPSRRFVATSPLGPRFDAVATDFGKGLHHDVHGPWEFDGSESEWRAYWDADDAVMRSEVGVSGASPVDLLEHFGLLGDGLSGGAHLRAELRQLWTHSSGWWLAEFDRSDPAQPIEEWVGASQRRQAVMLTYAAASTLSRFPRCAGFIVWLGHDTFPCAVSLSLLDYWGRPKPSARELGALFSNDPRLTSW